MELRQNRLDILCLNFKIKSAIFIVESEFDYKYGNALVKKIIFFDPEDIETINCFDISGFLRIDRKLRLNRKEKM